MLGLERLLKSNPYPSRNLTRLFLFYFPDQRIFALVCFLMPIFPPLFFAVFFHFPLDFLFADFFSVSLLAKEKMGAPQNVTHPYDGGGLGRWNPGGI